MRGPGPIPKVTSSNWMMVPDGGRYEDLDLALDYKSESEVSIVPIATTADNVRLIPEENRQGREIHFKKRLRRGLSAP